MAIYARHDREHASQAASPGNRHARRLERPRRRDRGPGIFAGVIPPPGSSDPPITKKLSAAYLRAVSALRLPREAGLIHRKGGAEVSDFSVVLFRSEFVLVSEKNHMKVHKNQGLSTPLPSDSPLWSYEPGRTLWCLGRRRLRSDPTWDDPQRGGLANT